MVHSQFDVTSPDGGHSVEKLPLRIKVAVIYGFFECLLFVGFLLGWSSVVYVFKQDGIYASECEDRYSFLSNETTDRLDPMHETGTNPTTGTLSSCGAQDERFSLAYTIAFGLSLLSCVVGWMLDKYGLRLTRLLGTCFFTSSMFIWAFTTPDRSWLIFLGAVSGGLATLVLMIVAANETAMAGRYSSVVVGLYQGGISAAPAVAPLGVKLAYDIGVTREHSLGFLAVLSLVCLTFGSFAMFPRFRATDFSTGIKTDPDMVPSQRNGIHLQHCTIHGQMFHVESENCSMPDTATTQSNEENPESSIGSLILSSLFVLHLFWDSVLHTRTIFTYNIFNSWLTRIFHGNINKVSHYTNLMGYMQVVNIAVAVIVGLVTDALRNPRKDYPGLDRASAACPGLLMTSLAGTALSCMFLDPVRQAGPETMMMVITILLQICLQSMVYSSSNTFFNLAYPIGQFGRLYGLLKAATGLISFSIHGLMTWGNTSQSGTHWFQVDLFLVVACALTLVHPLNIWRLCHRQKRNNLNTT